MPAFTRRQTLLFGALGLATLTLRDAAAQPRGRKMRVFIYSPHPDDETLSMGLAMVYYIASGCDVHLVSMNNGGALGAANTVNGVQACTAPADHPYTHSPAREGYVPLTVEDVADARIKEARGALGAMAMIPPTNPSAVGTVTHHIAGLPDSYGHPGAGSSTAPVTPEGIAAAKAVIKGFVDEYPNSFHFTMSESDKHYDHAACGYALRELKSDAVNTVPWNSELTYREALINARFFVSRLYWAISQPDGQYPQAVLDAAAIEAVPPATTTLAWFNYSGARKAEYDAWLRNQVQNVYKAWNPAAGTYALGYHQVATQFGKNFGPAASIANLWHA